MNFSLFTHVIPRQIFHIFNSVARDTQANKDVTFIKMKIFEVLLLCLTTVVLKLVGGEPCYEDEPCKTKSNGEDGIAKSPRSCSGFGSYSYQDKWPCGWFEGGSKLALVCCKISRDENLQQVTTEKIVTITEPPTIQASSRVDPRIVTQECEKFGEKPVDFLSDRVVDGYNSEVGEFPHFAMLGYRNNENELISFGCGGALISADFVMTAAHCCKTSLNLTLVRLGRVRYTTLSK